MYKPRTYIQMQLLQKEHDASYHEDIVVLETQTRLKHLTLHFSKYAARLAGAKGLPDLREKLEKTLTDTFIIALSAANVLNLDLDEVMSNLVGSPLIDQYPFRKGSMESIREYVMVGLVLGNGYLAKSLESMDHMEPGNHRENFESGTIEIIRAVVEASNALGMDLVDQTLSRWKFVEENKVL